MASENKSGFWKTLKFGKGMANVFGQHPMTEIQCRNGISAGYEWLMDNPAERARFLEFKQIKDVLELPKLLDAILHRSGMISAEQIQAIFQHLRLAATIGAESYIQKSTLENKKVSENKSGLLETHNE